MRRQDSKISKQWTKPFLAWLGALFQWVEIINIYLDAVHRLRHSSGVMECSWLTEGYLLQFSTMNNNSSLYSSLGWNPTIKVCWRIWRLRAPKRLSGFQISWTGNIRSIWWPLMSGKYVGQDNSHYMMTAGYPDQSWAKRSLYVHRPVLNAVDSKHMPWIWSLRFQLLIASIQTRLYWALLSVTAFGTPRNCSLKLRACQLFPFHLWF